MGMVFLGEHMLLGRRAAIKTLLPTVQVNQEIVERFFNEARAASTITDPGVIQIFDFGYHVDGTAYIVMELLEGESLSARIDRLGKLPLPDSIRIARQIAGSLAAAHARNIVHRDLKPENIFLVRDSEAQGGERTKILDFGICKLHQSEGDVAVTQVGAMVGTPVYMSPEQCRGSSDVDHRSDIYAFGCLLFHMLTGRPPFTGESSGDLIVAHMQADPPAPSLYLAGLPFEVDALLLRCLAKAPEDRFPSMGELHLVLGDIYAQLDPEELTIAPVTPAMQLGQGFRSVYDGNFSRIAGGSSRISPVSRISPGCRATHASRISPATHRLRPHLRYVATPPVTPPKMKSPSIPDLESDPELAALLRPRRHGLHAVLAGLVVAGVVIGLATTGLFRGAEDRAAEARPSPVAAAPGVHEPDPAVAAAPIAAAPGTSAIESASPEVVTTSPADRTVEREPASGAGAPISELAAKPVESGTAATPATDTRPGEAPKAETKPAPAVKSAAETKPDVAAKSVAETKPDVARTDATARPVVDSEPAADGKAEAAPEPGKAALEAKPETKLDVPKPEIGKRASARVASAPVTRPSERGRGSPSSSASSKSSSAPSKSPGDRPVVSPAETDSSSARSEKSSDKGADKGIVTSLKKGDPEPPKPGASSSTPSTPSAPSTSSAPSTQAPSRPPAPPPNQPPPPSRPSPSNEDLYDTR